MRDPLKYSIQELEQLNKSDLQKLYQAAEFLENRNNTEQLTLKTVLNSLYGALANKYFPLFNESIAQAITGNGRYFIQKLANYIEENLQQMNPWNKPYIISGDTDSVYYTINPFMEMFKKNNPDLSTDEYVNWADAFEKKVIQPIIKKCISDFAEDLNAYNKNIIGADREIIADKMLICEKKKYIARVQDSEGTRYPINDPYIKIMGVEVIKSTTPKWSKKHLKQSIPLILDKSEIDIKNWIKKIKSEFTKIDPNEIAIVGGVTRLDYDINGKGVPMGARAAIRHNMYIKEHDIENRIAPIQPGDKCKRIFLQTPNVFNSNVIAFTNEQFVNEFKDIINYDEQFLKGFMKPLSLMTNSLGYNLEQETEVIDDW